MKFFELKKKSDQKAFTLIETLIAIGILLIAITATFTSAQSGLATASEAKNQVLSYYLAQEAVEYIRNLRDNNALVGNNWLSGFAQNGSDPCYPGKSCTVDVPGNVLSQCFAGVNKCALTEDLVSSSPTYGMYGDAVTHPSWSATIFKREITINVLDATKEAIVTVTVSWTSGSFTRSFSVQESIYNWQQ